MIGKRMVFIPVSDIGLSGEQRDMLKEMFTKPSSYKFVDFKPIKIYWPVKPPKF